MFSQTRPHQCTQYITIRAIQMFRMLMTVTNSVCVLLVLLGYQTTSSVLMHFLLDHDLRLSKLLMATTLRNLDNAELLNFRHKWDRILSTAYGPFVLTTMPWCLYVLLSYDLRMSFWKQPHCCNRYNSYYKKSSLPSSRLSSIRSK